MDKIHLTHSDSELARAHEVMAELFILEVRNPRSTYEKQVKLLGHYVVVCDFMSDDPTTLRRLFVGGLVDAGVPQPDAERAADDATSPDSRRDFMAFKHVTEDEPESGIRLVGTKVEVDDSKFIDAILRLAQTT